MPLLLIKFILFPFAVLYDAVTSLRNILYERGYKPSATFEIPVIAVGNLTVGGTGKTPMTEYLIRLLHNQYNTAVLSRGYGRSTRGFVLADGEKDAAALGDEPFQIFSKFNGVSVAVGEERALAISYLLNERPDTELVLLDDAFQHRKVKPSFLILLTDFNRPFYKDFLLPAGRLRESRRGADRADVVVITKCPPNLSEEEMMTIERAVRSYTTKPLFFSRIRYGNPVSINGAGGFPDKVVLVSGIAKHQPFEAECRKHYKVVQHLTFRDHHQYSEHNVEEIVLLAKRNNAAVLMTEKDASKLAHPTFAKKWNNTPVFYLPIECEFIKNGKEFDEMVLNVVRSYKS